MNTIRSDFPNDIKQFFVNLQNYLDTELYFYGSVNRTDYIHNKSDIDIAVFTDNEQSVMTKLQHFLHVQSNAFDKIVWKLYGNMIYGYKIKCDKYIDVKCEIAIYNNEFKDQLLDDMRKCNTIPFYIAFMLNILKMFHYTIPIIPLSVYSTCKRILFNDLYLNKKDTVFFLISKHT